ncbi:MAG TPA: ELWxxDGT repeat protein, partial [Candidatus Babeliaceae bacterium]|nr:ELWxxDGT repeat protein [Candidatus Babeliaceae bacterium]
ISYKNRIFFASGDHTMWVTDGTSSGTKLFKNINPQFDAPSNFVSATNALLHNILFFAASDGITGMELWKTDGTAKGTAIVKDIQPGAGSAFTDEYKTGYFIKASQLIYFLADDGTHGTELWKTDGTTIGTIIVKDITPGSASTQISSLTAVGDKVAFLVYDPASKKEILWQSDGTENGTQPVNDSKLADITFTDYFNNLLVGYNNKLYFTAYMPGYGYELWAGKLNDSLNRSIMLSGNLINDNDAQLRWHTGDEIDADHFDIERSEDGVHFANIGSVTKNINGESNTGYSYLDKNISLKGRVYYRLHTIKGNGSKTISNVVLLSSTADVQLMVLPNPVESNFTVQVILQKGQQVQLQILNAQGTIMLSDHKSMNKGNNTVQYNAGLWRAGIYTLRLLLNNESVKELIIIKQ